MAQAARLNLRMQKELKLLLTDPPPGASFPLLSANSDLSSFSLSTIHAQIQGPEGTVYEKGTFKIDIQIPERYPFQPPTVTFATPIYHPNIDTGGRICLDILNLPPKGAWQPSLNISTVLTSIGLLLSEPNPDDGLMIEASKEYKYNRQAFNQKARSFAEKHARSGGSEIDSRNPNLQSHPNKITGESKESGLPSANGNEYAASSKKHLGMSRKLLLEPSGSSPRDSNKELKEQSFCHLSENQLGAQGPIQDSKDMSNECSREGTRRRLALGSLNTSISRNGDKKENVGPHLGTLMPVLQSSQLHEQPDETYRENQDFQPIVGVSKKLSIGQKQLLKTSKPDQRNDYCQENLAIMPRPLPYESVPKASEIQPQKGSVDKLVTGFTNPLRKKLGLAGKKSSSGFITSLQKENKDNKENIAPVTNTIRSPSMSSNTSRTVHLYEERSGSNNANTNAKKFPLQPLGQYEGIKECHTQLQQGQGERFAGGSKQSKDETMNLEAAIVLDSEDSEEEREGNSRSKLSIVRKRLPGKRKAIR